MAIAFEAPASALGAADAWVCPRSSHLDPILGASLDAAPESFGEVSRCAVAEEKPDDPVANRRERILALKQDHPSVPGDLLFNGWEALVREASEFQAARAAVAEDSPEAAMAESGLEQRLRALGELADSAEIGIACANNWAP